MEFRNLNYNEDYVDIRYIDIETNEVYYNKKIPMTKALLYIPCLNVGQVVKSKYLNDANKEERFIIKRLEHEMLMLEGNCEFDIYVKRINGNEPVKNKKSSRMTKEELQEFISDDLF